MDPETKTNARARLKRIAGQIAGIERMLDDDRYCVDVLHQVAAAQSALLETGKVILGGHFESCLAEVFENRDAVERRKKLDELIEVFARFGLDKAGRRGP